MLTFSNPFGNIDVLTPTRFFNYLEMCGLQESQETIETVLEYSQWEDPIMSWCFASSELVFE